MSGLVKLFLLLLFLSANKFYSVLTTLPTNFHWTIGNPGGKTELNHFSTKMVEKVSSSIQYGTFTYTWG